MHLSHKKPPNVRTPPAELNVSQTQLGLIIIYRHCCAEISFFIFCWEIIPVILNNATCFYELWSWLVSDKSCIMLTIRYLWLVDPRMQAAGIILKGVNKQKSNRLITIKDNDNNNKKHVWNKTGHENRVLHNIWQNMGENKKDMCLKGWLLSGSRWVDHKRWHVWLWWWDIMRQNNGWEHEPQTIKIPVQTKRRNRWNEWRHQKPPNCDN